MSWNPMKLSFTRQGQRNGGWHVGLNGVLTWIVVHPTKDGWIAQCDLPGHENEVTSGTTRNHAAENFMCLFGLPS